MKRRRWILLASLLLVASAAMLLVSLNSSRRVKLSDPVVQGQPISVWVTKALNTGDYQDTQKLRELGPDVVPHLTAALKRRTRMFNTVWVKVWPYLPGRIQTVLNILVRRFRM